MSASVQELSTSALPSEPSGATGDGGKTGAGRGNVVKILPSIKRPTLDARDLNLGPTRWHGLVQHALPWLVPVLLVVVWQVSASLGWLSSRVLPSPIDVFKSFWSLSISGELWTHVKISTGRAFLGLAIGGGLGLVLGLLTGSVKLFDQLLDSTIQMVRNIPALAMIPLVILWFGIDEAAKLFLIGLAVFFPIYINTYHGIKSVDPALVEMGRAYGLSRWQLYWQIVLPGALSSILVGLRFSLGLMWVILIVAETISSQSGIGYLTMNAREFLQTDVVLVGILLYAILGKLADWLARLLEKRLLRWNPNYR
ncbi:aliphatic sulfonate ABC transporter permease SsuC [Corticibacter populi]|uniref:Aliphatic sulfonate ABC transporter permease SsuC n=1 Tax=Corticibacter populi TaxID=1550736 RepID=A0A3M6QGK5_9BURK|nr:aliphatic sulfonate ABC transporter permease SsuC [Corticibacter populi]RMX02230.1 aliphatic sulfonate ABC transporter permease SsuC [Corticibacter populi]RZS29501.1 sulfonate transport system permease protein [Corticibacter populi]